MYSPLKSARQRSLPPPLAKGGPRGGGAHVVLAAHKGPPHGRGRRTQADRSDGSDRSDRSDAATPQTDARLREHSAALRGSHLFRSFRRANRARQRAPPILVPTRRVGASVWYALRTGAGVVGTQSVREPRFHAERGNEDSRVSSPPFLAIQKFSMKGFRGACVVLRRSWIGKVPAMDESCPSQSPGDPFDGTCQTTRDTRNHRSG